MPDPKLVQNKLLVVLILGFTGLALALEGFYYTAGTGLLFGSYICNAGFACEAPLQHLLSTFRFGMFLLLPGLGLVVTSGLLSRVIWRERLGGKVRLFASRRQKWAVISSVLVSLMLILAFLAPIVPFNKTFPNGTQPDNFPVVNVCYQTVQSVHNPSLIFSGFESISRSLFGIGNYLYVQCNVVSGP